MGPVAPRLPGASCSVAKAPRHPWKAAAVAGLGQGTHGSRIGWFCTGMVPGCRELVHPMEPRLCPPCRAVPCWPRGRELREHCPCRMRGAPPAQGSPNTPPLRSCAKARSGPAVPLWPWGKPSSSLGVRWGPVRHLLPRGSLGTGMSPVPAGWTDLWGLGRTRVQVPIDPPTAVAQPLSRTPSLPQGPNVPRGLAGARQETDTAGARPCSLQSGFTGGWGRHRDPHAQHGAEGEGVEVGSGGRVLIQQLMDPSMAGCLSVQLPGAGWLHVLGPQSGSGQGLGESWGETGASVSQALDSEHARAAGPWGRGLPRPLPGELLGALPVTSAACKDMWGRCTPAMATLIPGRVVCVLVQQCRADPAPTPWPPHAHLQTPAGPRGSRAPGAGAATAAAWRGTGSVGAACSGTGRGLNPLRAGGWFQ